MTSFCLVLNPTCLTGATTIPRISALPVSSAGMAELQKILKSSLFELMCDNLETAPPKIVPKPESVKKYEQHKLRKAQGKKIKYWKRKYVSPRIPDEQLLLGGADQGR